VHQVLLVIAEEQVGGPLPLPAIVKAALDDPASDTPIDEGVLAWIGLLDHCAMPALLRTAVTNIEPSEAALSALVRYFWGKERRSDNDRERADWLITHIFRERQREGVFSGKVDDELPEIIPGIDVSPLGVETRALIGGLGKILQEVSKFTTFQEMNRSEATTRGRALKKELHQDFFHLRVLSAIITYNLAIGQRFNALFAAATARREQLGAMLAHKEYRLAAMDFAKLAETSEQPSAQAPATPAPAAPNVPRPQSAAAAASIPAPARAPEPTDDEPEPPSLPNWKADRELPPGWNDPVEEEEETPSTPAPRRFAPPTASYGGLAAPSQMYVDTRPQFDDRDLVREQMREMGLDPKQESHNLEVLLATIAKSVATLTITPVVQLRLPNCNMPAMEWELRALTAEFAENDDSFRAEFTRKIRHAFGIRAAAANEWVVYEHKRDTTEFLWKKHYDSLVWLLFEGRYASEELERFAQQTEMRGLPDRASQVRKTAAHLNGMLERLAKIF